jgi:hypothetical protein
VCQHSLTVLCEVLAFMASPALASIKRMHGMEPA